MLKRCTLAILVAAAFRPAAAPAVDWLPDMIVRESDLYDNDVTTSVAPGRVHLRLSNGTANIGLGPLHIMGGESNGDGTQQVLQRVFADDGSYYDRLAGNFIHHPTHGHVHFEGWALYQLREILPDDGVGDVLAKGEKTSFCLIDGGIQDSGLPNFSGSSYYTSCGETVQGISVGWYDVYGSYLTGQNIDITDVIRTGRKCRGDVNVADVVRACRKWSNNVHLHLGSGNRTGNRAEVRVHVCGVSQNCR